jgi:hypothetical protein
VPSNFLATGRQVKARKTTKSQLCYAGRMIMNTTVIGAKAVIFETLKIDLITEK